MPESRVRPIQTRVVTIKGHDYIEFGVRVPRQAIETSGVKITIEIADIGAGHPNTYQMTIRNYREAQGTTAHDRRLPRRSPHNGETCVRPQG